jgi:hypothetical protein
LLRHGEPAPRTKYYYERLPAAFKEHFDKTMETAPKVTEEQWTVLSKIAGEDMSKKKEEEEEEEDI